MYVSAKRPRDKPRRGIIAASAKPEWREWDLPYKQEPLSRRGVMIPNKATDNTPVRITQPAEEERRCQEETQPNAKSVLWVGICAANIRMPADLGNLDVSVPDLPSKMADAKCSDSGIASQSVSKKKVPTEENLTVKSSVASDDHTPDVSSDISEEKKTTVFSNTTPRRRPNSSHGSSPETCSQPPSSTTSPVSSEQLQNILLLSAIKHFFAQAGPETRAENANSELSTAEFSIPVDVFSIPTPVVVDRPATILFLPHFFGLAGPDPGGGMTEDEELTVFELNMDKYDT